jgi:hypothetical protein
MEMVLIGQDAGDVGQHAGLVFDAQAQVVGGFHLRPGAGSA